MFVTGEEYEQKNEGEGGNKDVIKAGMPSGIGRVLAKWVGGRSGKVLCILQRSVTLFYREEGAMKSF